MKTTTKLTKTLLSLCKENLEDTISEKSAPTRTGLTIKAIRAAIEKADVYIYNGVPHFFGGKIYEPVTIDEFKGCIYDVLIKADLKPADFVMLEKIQRISVQAVQGKPLALRKDIIVFENCVLVLPDLTPTDEIKVEKEKKKKPKLNLQKHSPSLAQVTMCNFNFDPEADCPRWDMFLEEVLDNLQLRMVLQEYLGCLFVDRKAVKLESMLILIGNGSNGKGVVSETVRNLIGKNSTTSFGLDSLLVGVESLHNIAKMNGKRVNWCTEIQSIQAGRFSDKLKTLISGEPIECRQMYGQPFAATDIPLMIANCNSLPPLQDRSYGMQRRFIIIRFDKTIPVEQQDKTLLKKLEPEYPGIFNWMLEGRQRFIDHGYAFTRCKAIDESVQNYIDAANNVEEWLKIKTYKPNPTDILEQEPMRVFAKTLYDEYRRWCISENIAPFTIAKFGTILQEDGFNKIRTAKGFIYRIYGEKALAVLSMRKAKFLNAALEDNGAIVRGQKMMGGRVYDVGDASASEQWHISRPYMTILRNKGYFDGIYHTENIVLDTADGRKLPVKANVYDHIRLGQRLEAMGIYDSSDDFSKLSDRRKQQVREAKEFNIEMKKLGKPFRKFAGKGQKYPTNTVFVDVDWEYTADAADLAASQAVIKAAERLKEKEVKIDKAGNMRKASKRKRLADAMAAKIDGDPIADTSGVDEDGKPIEVDVNDDDLRISE